MKDAKEIAQSLLGEIMFDCKNVDQATKAFAQAITAARIEALEWAMNELATINANDCCHATVESNADWLHKQIQSIKKAGVK